MKQVLRIGLLGSWIGLVSACGAKLPFLEGDAPSRQAQGPPRELAQWVDEELIPYLVKQFSHHPRFKDQRFLVVSMQGDEIQAELDDLTRYIRDRVRTVWLQTPGLRPPWRPALTVDPPYRLADLTCGEFAQIHYYLGVDIRRSPLDGAVEVSVRALDRREKSWVSGFHRSWRGQISPAQHLALRRRHQDESLRGLRALPFTAEQPDLLAAYLAHNLSCLLRHHRHLPEETLFYASPPPTETHPYFRTALALVGNYLGRFREVRLTEDPEQATMLLESQIYPLHDNLHQVWVTLRHAHNRRLLSGTETEAYVRLEPDTVDRQTRPLPSKPPPFYGSSRRADSRDLEAALPAFSSPPSVSEKLLGGLRLSFVTDRAECLPKNRGFNMNWISRFGNFSPDTPCLAVEATVNRSARLVLVGQNSRGQLRWLTPSPCQDNYPAGIHLPAGQTFRTPLLPHQIRFLELDSLRGQSWVYAIAISERSVDDLLDERWVHVRGLVAKQLRHRSSADARAIVNRLGLCDARGRSQRPVSVWIRDLKAIATENGPRMEWEGIRLWHSRDSRL